MLTTLQQENKMTKKRSILLTGFLAVVLANIYIISHHNPLAVVSQEVIKKIISCVITDVLFLAFTILYDKIVILPIELYQNRKLIMKLAKNDFKSKYAGSYLGVVWAFVQPIVTVLVYWFVFEIGLRGGQKMERYPFVLWLIAGIVPWFFFSDALSQGTSALLSYQYLVKKVVFKISILPIIKVISALFIHCFFTCFAIILVGCYGFTPTWYTLQVIYFTFCMFMLVLGLSYVTCSVIVFFRDLGQIISIALQVGIWITPIMWQLDTMPRIWQMIFKLNPVYYIVDGYRMALLDKMWFWEHFYSTAYFWIFTLCTFGIGALVFKKLKIHFADVL